MKDTVMMKSDKITGLSESQVKVYLHRARVQLKEYLVKIENVI